eukprot:gene25052-31462_t
MSQLQYFNVLYLNKNYFTSTIPPVFGDLNQLNFLSLSENLLTGTLSAQLSKLRSLEALFLFSNLLSGSVEQLFSASVQTKLKYVDLSSNQLQGSLPVEVFKIKGLRSFAAVSNCFQGAIPDAICSAENLTTLALDGLKSASSCERRFFPAWTHIHSYGLSEHISGGVPVCLFRMPHLQTLHLSGNGLTGSIQTDTSLGARLRDLSLSHNNFRGEVPSAIHTHPWTNLDLSYNKLNGVLSADMPALPLMSSVRTIVFHLLLFILLVLMPAYIALSHYYDTYSYEYAWSVTAAYLSGVHSTV